MMISNQKDMQQQFSFIFLIILSNFCVEWLIQIFLATYGTAGTLPLVLAGKCEDSTCTTLTTDLDVVKACFNDPTDATNCRGMLFT